MGVHKLCMLQDQTLYTINILEMKIMLLGESGEGNYKIGMSSIVCASGSWNVIRCDTCHQLRQVDIRRPQCTSLG